MERIVSRRELHSPTSTSERAASLDAAIRSNNVEAFNYVNNNDVFHGSAGAEAGDDGLEFRMFATTRKGEGEASASRVRLRSPTPLNTTPGFVDSNRDRSYYLVGTRTAVESARYEHAAVSGAEVLDHSRTPWPGSACPWKIIHLPVHNGQRRTVSALCETPAAAGIATEGTKRKRPGKQARIKVRIKLATLQAQTKAVEIDAKAREAAEREKRVRTNRSKKLKKRARDKAKKAGAVGDAEDEEVD
ncbi:hypothetical protein LTR53_013163 [Teratosphaeriaceae sp. CCFEE 6253]|nr:hypothetical protein LTR53_013163 [Teratosphaeriaceae sp. CCFEE 6253]